jgi:small-conductance mechanosensitive channel
MYAQLASGKTLPMPCGWTARAEIGLGVLLVVTGILLAIAKSNETKRIIGIFGTVIGVLAILFPTYITKMCGIAEHPCNLVTKPVLILLGLAAIIVSAYVAYSARAD